MSTEYAIQQAAKDIVGAIDCLDSTDIQQLMWEKDGPNDCLGSIANNLGRIADALEHFIKKGVAVV